MYIRTRVRTCTRIHMYCIIKAHKGTILTLLCCKYVYNVSYQNKFYNVLTQRSHFTNCDKFLFWEMFSHKVTKSRF